MEALLFNPDSWLIFRSNCAQSNNFSAICNPSKSWVWRHNVPWNMPLLEQGNCKRWWSQGRILCLKEKTESPNAHISYSYEIYQIFIYQVSYIDSYCCRIKLRRIDRNKSDVPVTWWLTCLTWRLWISCLVLLTELKFNVGSFLVINDCYL